MQNLTIKVPDNKLAFFLELVNSLGFVKVEQPEAPTIVLSKEQLNLVEEERQKLKQSPDYLIDWNKARKSLKVD